MQSPLEGPQNRKTQQLFKIFVVGMKDLGTFLNEILEFCHFLDLSFAAILELVKEQPNYPYHCLIYINFTSAVS